MTTSNLLIVSYPGCGVRTLIKELRDEGYDVLHTDHWGYHKVQHSYRATDEFVFDYYSWNVDLELMLYQWVTCEHTIFVGYLPDAEKAIRKLGIPTERVLMYAVSEERFRKNVIFYRTSEEYAKKDVPMIRKMYDEDLPLDLMCDRYHSWVEATAVYLGLITRRIRIPNLRQGIRSWKQHEQSKTIAKELHPEDPLTLEERQAYECPECGEMKVDVQRRHLGGGDYQNMCDACQEEHLDRQYEVNFDDT